MVKLVVLYGRPDDTEAFDAHYRDVHVPLAEAIPGLQRLEVATFLPGPDGSAPPYYQIAELWFADGDALGAALSSPEGQRAVEDATAIATGGMTVVPAAIV